MENSTWLLRFLVILGANVIIQINGRLNFFIKTFKLCDPNFDYPQKAYATFPIIENRQCADANATLKTPLDDNLRTNVTVQLLVGKKYIQIIKIEEKRTCSNIHRYFGELAYDIERHAQLVPGLCPIPAGRYYVHNYPLNFNLMTVQNFPFGHLRFTLTAFDNNNKLVICLIIEVENMP